MRSKSSIEKQSLLLYTAYACCVALGVLGAIALDQPLLVGLPFGLLLAFQTLVDFRRVFFLLLICIPLSAEVYFGSFGTDLPTEPLMVGLMLVYLIYFLSDRKKLDGRFFRHPLMLLLILHLSWTLIATINSNLMLISVKFLIAKIWYVAVFVFVAGLMLREKKDIKLLFWCIFLPMLFTGIVVLYKQNHYGFSLEFIGKAMHPFYRNHVSYAAIFSTFFPFLWFARRWYPVGSFNWLFISFSTLIFLICIQLSFTRAAYVAIIMAFGAYFVIYFRFVKPVLLAASLGTILFFGYLVHNNKYLDYAPNFEKTISHHNFDDLLEATYNMEDISTMERLYRWVAGVRMSNEEKVTGFGPGNFYTFYKGYTVAGFETYVSDNPERSGVHNYYLMMLVDQGVPGLVFFLFLTFGVLIVGERVYHETLDPQAKEMVMMVLLSLIIIDAFLLINDLIETDKVGSFYFMNIAILINFDLRNKTLLASD